MPLTGGLLNTLISLLEFLLPQSFMGFQTQPIVYFIVFLLFVYLAYRFLKLTFKGILIFIAAALFPLLANYFLGLDIGISFNSILSYGLTGLFLYIAGMLLKSVVSILKAVTWPFRKIFGGSEEERIEELEEELEEEEK